MTCQDASTCRPARGGRACDDRPKHIPFDPAGHLEATAPQHWRSSASPRSCSRWRFPLRVSRSLPVPAFVASYQSALAVSDIITAVLLLSQFAVLRTRALLWLATGYLFTAAAAAGPRPHLPRAVRPDRAVRRRPADHRLALHDLARRLPAVRAGLCLAEGERRRRPDSDARRARAIYGSVLGVDRRD